jgi:hypothetical protein
MAFSLQLEGQRLEGRLEGQLTLKLVFCGYYLMKLPGNKMTNYH